MLVATAGRTSEGEPVAEELTPGWREEFSSREAMFTGRNDLLAHSRLHGPLTGADPQTAAAREPTALSRVMVGCSAARAGSLTGDEAIQYSHQYSQAR